MRPPSTAKPLHYFSAPLSSAPAEYLRHVTRLEVAGITLSMATGDGVFSKDRLDAGSRILLHTTLERKELRAARRICDLGCGWGALGCFLAAHFRDAQISMCDINARAAFLAAFNARQNQLENARVWCGDGLAAARAEYFDLIVCNPPIRAGNATISRMFRDAQRCLRAGGVLCVVIRTAQGAKSWQKRLAELFGDCETLAIESGYRVLKCVK
jgi:16S rRNA (guanine1207-N2)-methyltransferase